MTLTADSEAVPATLDLDHLARYTGGDGQLEREILGMFLPSVRGYLEQMQQADADTPWMHAAHAMKGVARGVGAFSLADLVESVELRFPLDAAERRSAVEAIAAQISAVEAAIEVHLSD